MVLGQEGQYDGLGSVCGLVVQSRKILAVLFVVFGLLAYGPAWILDLF